MKKLNISYIKMIVLFELLFIFWALATQLAFADNSHNTTIIVKPYPYATPQTTNTVVEKTSCDGSALGVAAAQHQFDFGTHSWQWSAGASYVDKNGAGCEALSFGIGKRIDRAVINGSISHESDATAYGIGINGRF